MEESERNEKKALVLACDPENMDGPQLRKAVLFLLEGIWTDYAAHFDSNPEHTLLLLNRGVEEFGSVSIAADMEEWDGGGLYVVAFMDSPRCWFAPFGLAVCRAYLLAWQVRQKETP